MPTVLNSTLQGQRDPRLGLVPMAMGSGGMKFTAGQMLQVAINSVELLRPLLQGRTLTERGKTLPAMRSDIWLCWTYHVRYLEVMMRSSFTEASISLLSKLITLQGELFQKIPMYKHLWKPKNHFARHIVTQIRMFGAPRNYWCMRFEAKNQEFKRAAKTSNFFNIPKAVAEHWEGRSACILRKRMLAGRTSLQFAVTQARSEPVHAVQHRHLMRAIPDLAIGSHISWLEQVSIHYNAHLRPGSWVLLQMAEGVRIAYVDFLLAAPQNQVYVGLNIYFSDCAVRYEADGAMFMHWSYLDNAENRDLHVLRLLDINLTLLYGVGTNTRVHFIEKH